VQKYKKVGYNIGGALTRAITTGNKVMRSIYYELHLQLGLEHTELMQYGNLEFAKNYAVEKVGICIEVVYELPELWHNVDAKCGHSGTCSILVNMWLYCAGSLGVSTLERSERHKDYATVGCVLDCV